MAKHSNRRGRRGKKQKDEERRTQEREEREHYDPEQREKRHLEMFVNFGLISEALMEYLNGVKDVLDSDQLQEDEDRQIFLRNVYTEIDGQELKLLGDPISSVVLEKLFLASSPEQVLQMLRALRERLIDAVTHRFASHGCQTLLRLAAAVVDKEIRQGLVSSEEQSEMATCVLDLMRDLKPHLIPMMYDVFSSHVVRSTLYVLAGRPIEDDQRGRNALRSKRSAQFSSHNVAEVAKDWQVHRLEVPSSFGEMLAEFATHIISGLNVPKLRDLSFDAMANPVLQLLLTFQESGDIQLEGDSVLDRFVLGLKDDESNQHHRECVNYLSSLLRDRVGSHLFEKIVQCAPPAIFTRLFSTVFRGKLGDLCADPVANFVVQRIMPACNGPEQLELILSEVVPLFPKLYKTRPGVLRSAVDACVALNCGHKGVVKGLREAVKIQSREDDKHFCDVYLRLQTLEEYTSYAIKRFHVQGSLVLQSLLKFPEDRNRIVIDSILARSKEELMRWAGDATASHVLEAFFATETVSPKTKQKVAEKLTGSFHQLALSPYGGHILDKCWLVIDLAQKVGVIAQELLAHEQTLYGSRHGKFILRNCRIDGFKRRREQWRQQQQGLARRRDMFKDIIEPNDKVSRNDALVCCAGDRLMSILCNSSTSLQPGNQHARLLQTGTATRRMFKRPHQKRKSARSVPRMEMVTKLMRSLIRCRQTNHRLW
ncbi:armadillo-type protein [Thamnocephalis sphaerospora]|uniref:Nucleolar protein 9 n=1 Tax=Thamnocephalis sphaerospora TaxID=78915 RepID=A0A4P9XLM3_9FUNG|nr:armadillo-type protein [Thamnocephalis sphaerospora]|eukprot:RKP06773.1 armadillo-type protein [Thamnocephalis sphaerospora]